MKKGIFFFMAFWFSIVWSQQDSSNMPPPEPYWDALRYLQSFKDSTTMKYFAGSHLSKMKSSSMIKLAVSNDLLPTHFRLLTDSIFQSAICNPMNLTRSAIGDSLFVADRKSYLARPTYKWPDSLTQIPQPDLTVFFSARYKNMFTACLFECLDPKKGVQRYKDYERNSSYEYKLFLFATDTNGKTIPIIIVDEIDNVTYAGPKKPSYVLPSDSLVEKWLEENSENK
jgi:hypothetical protein